MSMTDPVADLLTRVRNASKARQQKTDVPWSRLKEQVARVLAEEGYVRDFVVSGEGARKVLTVVMRYTSEGDAVITGIRRVSKPGLRTYTSARKAPVVRGGLGVSILSTPQGVVADREARRRNVGGEVLCEVW
jgi:small subunit ribosomal protein S8